MLASTGFNSSLYLVHFSPLPGLPGLTWCNGKGKSKGKGEGKGKGKAMARAMARAKARARARARANARNPIP